MSAVPFYAVDTSTRTLECTRSARSNRKNPSKDTHQRSSSFTRLSTSCHDEESTHLSTQSRPASSSSSSLISAKKAFDSFTN